MSILHILHQLATSRLTSVQLDTSRLLGVQLRNIQISDCSTLDASRLMAVQLRMHPDLQLFNWSFGETKWTHSQSILLLLLSIMVYRYIGQVARAQGKCSHSDGGKINVQALWLVNIFLSTNRRPDWHFSRRMRALVTMHSFWWRQHHGWWVMWQLQYFPAWCYM